MDISGLNHHSPWKAAFLRKKRIETAWQTGNVNPRELIGHDDHVVTCLQFDGNRIVSGSDDNTLKVKITIFKIFWVFIRKKGRATNFGVGDIFCVF